MKEILIVETRDAAESLDAARTLDLARGISRTGSPATILLTDNGAFNARRGHGYDADKAIADGVRLCVDTFALTERGIGEDELKAGVSVASMDSLVEHLIDGSCVIWR